MYQGTEESTLTASPFPLELAVSGFRSNYDATFLIYHYSGAILFFNYVIFFFFAFTLAHSFLKPQALI